MKAESLHFAKRWDLSDPGQFDDAFKFAVERYAGLGACYLAEFTLDEIRELIHPVVYSMASVARAIDVIDGIYVRWGSQ